MTLSEEPNPNGGICPAAAGCDSGGDPAGRTDCTLKLFGADAQNLLAASRRRERLGLGVAVMVALLMHITLLYALTRHRNEDGPAGAGGVELDAISVEVNLVPSRALQSQADTAAPASGIASKLAPNEGGHEQRHSEPQAKRETIEVEPEQEQTTAHLQEMPALHMESQEEPREDSERPVAPHKKVVPDAPPPAVPGGTTTHADVVEREAVQGAATASAGAMRAYAGRIVQALNKSKPKSPGARGTVRISFALLPDGSLDFVRIITSSGNERLDHAAVAAVRQASFPLPPAGMSPLQRTYVLPYRFH
jgi:protein TonB